MVLGELELCLQSTLLHHEAKHHQGASRRGQEALLTQWRALEDVEASCHQHISSCLNRLCILPAKQAELIIHLSPLLLVSIGTEVSPLEGSIFHPELML